jgi:hypothetical protein
VSCIRRAPVPRDLELETLVEVLAGRPPLLVTAYREQDIHSALRVAAEFDIRVVIDGAAEAYLMLDAIADAGVPLLLHPTMARQFGELEKQVSRRRGVSMRRESRLHHPAVFDATSPPAGRARVPCGMAVAAARTPVRSSTLS